MLHMLCWTALHLHTGRCPRLWWAWIRGSVEESSHRRSTTTLFGGGGRRLNHMWSAIAGNNKTQGTKHAPWQGRQANKQTRCHQLIALRSMYPRYTPTNKSKHSQSSAMNHVGHVVGVVNRACPGGLPLEKVLTPCTAQHTRSQPHT